MATKNIPANVRDLALKHNVNVRLDENGIYSIWSEWEPYPWIRQSKTGAIAAIKSIVRNKTAGRTENPISNRKQYVNRKSQITKKAPTKRLKKRRVKNFDAPAKGRFPNPAKRETLHFVFGEGKRGGGFYNVNHHSLTTELSEATHWHEKAKASAQVNALKRQSPAFKWRVQSIAFSEGR